MPVDTEQWHAETGNFNGCLYYAIVKLKLNLFNIMLSVRQVLTFTLAITFQYIFKFNTVFYSLNIFCICFVICLRVHNN